MKNVYILLLGFILVFGGCTKNNQNDPSTYAYLNVNQTFVMQNNNQSLQTYDIDNDGQVDWGFAYSVDNGGLIHYGSNYTSYIKGSLYRSCKVIPVNYTISSTEIYFQPTSGSSSNYAMIWGTTSNNVDINTNVLGSGDFYIGFKSQNPTYTNSFYGWARLNISSDGNTLIVKDMAMNKVNGGSINAGQR